MKEDLVAEFQDECRNWNHSRSSHLQGHTFLRIILKVFWKFTTRSYSDHEMLWEVHQESLFRCYTSCLRVTHSSLKSQQIARLSSFSFLAGGFIIKTQVSFEGNQMSGVTVILQTSFATHYFSLSLLHSHDCQWKALLSAAAVWTLSSAHEGSWSQQARSLVAQLAPSVRLVFQHLLFHNIL